MDENIKIEDYSDTIYAIDFLVNERKEMVESLIPPEVKEKMEEIIAEYKPKLEGLEHKRDALERELKAATIARGFTIKGNFHAFTFVKGRTTWDSKSLEGYAAAHPEILAFRKIGEPSVSVKKV